MSDDRWSAVRQLVAANTLCAGAIGYCLGRCRPLHHARTRARYALFIGKDPGRLRTACIIALLPERFAPLIWHRIRQGQYPAPPPRRRAQAPALVHRHTDNTSDGSE